MGVEFAVLLPRTPGELASKPEHLKRWMGSRSLTMVLCETHLGGAAAEAAR